MVRPLSKDLRERVVAASAIEETVPLGGPAQPAYLNQMVLLDTELEPHQLLAELQAIEQRRGRVRGPRCTSRRAGPGGSGVGGR